MDLYGEGTTPEAKARQVKVRCVKCERLLAEMVTAPWAIKCPRCKHVNRQDDDSESA